MAQIYLRNQSEPIEVSEEEANRIVSQRNDPRFRDLISINGRQIIKTDIREVRLETKIESDDWRERNLEYFRKRNELLALPPEERAKVSAWGHFSLFFWGLKGRTPKPDSQFKVLNAAAKFYAENPNWARPSVKVWESMLNLKPGYKLNGMALAVLERGEGQELSEVKR